VVDQTCKKLGLGLSHDPTLILAIAPEAHALGVKEITLAELEIVIEDSQVLAA
jgi:hypothetical protein